MRAKGSPEGSQCLRHTICRKAWGVSDWHACGVLSVGEKVGDRRPLEQERAVNPPVMAISGYYLLRMRSVPDEVVNTCSQVLAWQRTRAFSPRMMELTRTKVSLQLPRERS